MHYLLYLTSTLFFKFNFHSFKKFFIHNFKTKNFRKNKHDSSFQSSTYFSWDSQHSAPYNFHADPLSMTLIKQTMIKSVSNLLILFHISASNLGQCYDYCNSPEDFEALKYIVMIITPVLKKPISILLTFPQCVPMNFINSTSAINSSPRLLFIFKLLVRRYQSLCLFRFKTFLMFLINKFKLFNQAGTVIHLNKSPTSTVLSPQPMPAAISIPIKFLSQD